MVGGLVLISMATPWVSADGARALVRAAGDHRADGDPADDRRALLAVRAPARHAAVLGPLCWLPFVLLIVVFVLGFLGLAYSIYPFVVHRPADDLAGRQQPGGAEGDPVGVCIAVPAIAGYTVFSYRVFRGKTGELRYA